MRRSMRSFLVAGILLAAIVVGAWHADARGRVSVRFGAVVRDSYAWPRYSYGWPYCGVGACAAGPYDTGIEAGLPAGAGLGAIQLSVRPGDADVWIDGKYVGRARDLDGYPTPLWLRHGSHRLVVSKDGYQRFDEKVAVRPGGRAGMTVRLEKSSH